MESNLHKHKIFISEDIARDLERIKLALISSNAPGDDYLSVIAHEHLEIWTTGIAGELIERLQNDTLPEVVIFDIDYTHITEEACNGRFSYAIECQKTRGIDILRTIGRLSSANVRSIAFTGHIGSPEIFKVVQDLRIGKDLFIKCDKGNSTETLAEYLPVIFNSIAREKYAIATIKERAYFRQLCENQPTEVLLNSVITISGRQYRVRDFIIGWITFILHPDHPEQYKIHVHDLTEILTDLEAAMPPAPEIKLNGIWKDPFMQEALQSYANHPEYRTIQKKLHKSVFNFLLAFCKDKRQQRYEALLNYIDISAYKCTKFKKMPWITFSDPTFRTCFLNSLKLRLVFITMQYIKNDKTLIPNPANGQFMTNIITYLRFTKCYASLEGMRKLINIELGLSGTFGEIEQIILEQSKIQRSEWEWLEEYGHLLIERIKKNDWTPL